MDNLAILFTDILNLQFRLVDVSYLDYRWTRLGVVGATLHLHQPQEAKPIQQIHPVGQKRLRKVMLVAAAYRYGLQKRIQRTSQIAGLARLPGLPSITLTHGPAPRCANYMKTKLKVCR